jgi:branched-chain amino acid transport system substrate-binding protein
MHYASPLSRRSRKLLGATAALVVLLGTTACGSDGPSDDSDKETSKPAAAEAPEGSFPGTKASGEPVKVGLINPEDGPAISQPEGREAAEAVVEYANEHLGGLGGRPIELVICKAKEDPASNGACANQMVQEKVVGVVVANTANGEAMAPVITGAGIAYTGYNGASGSELTGKNSFLWTGGVASVIASFAKTAAAEGVKDFTLFGTDNASVVGALKQMGQPIFKAAGIGLEIVPIPLGTPDTTPQVSAGLKSEPGAVGIVGDANMCASTLKALETLGNEAPRYVIQFCVEDSTIKAAGPAAYDNAFLFTSADGASDDKEAQIYRAVMAEYAPDVDTAGSAVTAYQSMLGFIRAAGGVQGDVTAESVVTAISSAKDVPVPVGHGATMTCDGKQFPGLTAICNASSLAGKLKDGKVVSYELVK